MHNYSHAYVYERCYGSRSEMDIDQFLTARRANSGHRTADSSCPKILYKKNEWAHTRINFTCIYKKWSVWIEYLHTSDANNSRIGPLVFFYNFWTTQISHPVARVGPTSRRELIGIPSVENRRLFVCIPSQCPFSSTGPCTPW